MDEEEQPLDEDKGKQLLETSPLKQYLSQIDGVTGVCQDYLNEYYELTLVLKLDGIEGVITKLKESPIQKYEEKYPLDTHGQVINDPNRERISRLDEIAETTNFLIMDDSGKFTEEHFKKTVNEVYSLVYGKDKPISNFYKEVSG